MARCQPLEKLTVLSKNQSLGTKGHMNGKIGSGVDPCDKQNKPMDPLGDEELEQKSNPFESIQISHHLTTRIHPWHAEEKDAKERDRSQSLGQPSLDSSKLSVKNGVIHY